MGDSTGAWQRGMKGMKITKGKKQITQEDMISCVGSSKTSRETKQFVTEKGIFGQTDEVNQGLAGGAQEGAEGHTQRTSQGLAPVS